MDKTTKPSNQQTVIAVLGVAVVVLTVGIAVLLFRPATIVASFEQCRKAGGALLESYPEQCMINGASFTNSAQSVDFDTDKYIGLTESEAVDRAKRHNTPARVVERDGESLPTTMDFIFGRYNLYVNDGKVFKVEAEGQAQDN